MKESNIIEDEFSTIKVPDGKGGEKVCDVLFTFDNDETKKSYIAYTDNSKDEAGRVRVYASIYDPNNMSKPLEDIKTEKEWKVIEAIIETVQENLGGTPSNN